jgi:hypothetical protein
MKSLMWIVPSIIIGIWIIDVSMFEYKQYKQRIKNDKK